MRRTIVVLLGTVVCGCATVLGGGSNQSVSITSSPGSANFVVKAASGLQMAAGKTPQTVTLPRSNEYQIDITEPGYQPQTTTLTKGVNGWTFVNVLFWPGFIVDFVTGAAYKLQPALINVTLQRGAGSTDDNRMFSHIRVFDDHGHLLTERTQALIPIR